MNFVNQVNLEAPVSGGILHIVQQFAGVFDLGAGGRIHFNQVDKSPIGNVLAGCTDTAGC